MPYQISSKLPQGFRRDGRLWTQEPQTVEALTPGLQKELRLGQFSALHIVEIEPEPEATPEPVAESAPEPQPEPAPRRRRRKRSE